MWDGKNFLPGLSIKMQTESVWKKQIRNGFCFVFFFSGKVCNFFLTFQENWENSMVRQSNEGCIEAFYIGYCTHFIMQDPWLSCQSVFTSRTCRLHHLVSVTSATSGPWGVKPILQLPHLTQAVPLQFKSLLFAESYVSGVLFHKERIFFLYTNWWCGWRKRRDN